MNRFAHGHRIRAGSVAALIAASGLVLAACSTTTTPSAGSSGTGTGSSSGSGNSSGSGGSTSVVSSSSVPFPIAVGNTWVYKTSEIAGSTVRTDKIIAVKPVAGGNRVTMSSTDTILGTKHTSQSDFVFHSDGSITYPFNQFNTGSTTKVQLISGGLFWPPAAEIASGRPFHSTLKISIGVGGVHKSVVAHVTVQGGGTASVSVPAGTYNTTIVNMTMAETVEGFQVSSEVRTWLANGVGPVKSEVIIREGGTGRVAAEDQLISFTKA
jgi:hypothetical protein